MNNYVWVLLEGSRPHPLSTDMDSTYLRDGFEANKPRTYIIYTAGLEKDEVASSNAISCPCQFVKCLCSSEWTRKKSWVGRFLV
jgi:hypothetical protein